MQCAVRVVHRHPLWSCAYDLSRYVGVHDEFHGGRNDLWIGSYRLSVLKMDFGHMVIQSSVPKHAVQFALAMTLRAMGNILT